MKTKSVNLWFFLPLVVLLTAVMTSCDEDYYSLPGNNVDSEGIMIGAEGGLASFMDDNVVLDIPPGALDRNVIFRVQELTAWPEADFVLKAIVIEPTVTFITPVQISLCYRGCLGNGVYIYPEMNLIFSLWDNESDFMGNFASPKHCSSCSISEDNETICMCICQTGVLVIMENN